MLCTIFSCAKVTGLLSLIALVLEVQQTMALPTSPIQWEIETVSTSSSPLLQPKSELALDANGDPHIIFQRKHQPAQSEGDIFHAFRDSGSWQVEHVAACSLCDVRLGAAFDDLNRLHTVYNDSGALKYGVLSNDTWQIETVPTPGLQVGELDLAIDSSQLPHVVSTGGGYLMFDGADWNIEMIPSPAVPYSIALNDLDQPIVAGLSYPNLIVAGRDSSGWTSEVVGHGGLEPSLALDSGGTPHIGHAVINDDDLRYATLVGADWTNDIVLNLGSGAFGPSLAIGTNNRPQLSYELNFDDPLGADDQVMHAYFNGVEWISSVVDPNLSTESRTSLAISPDGFSHVVYAIQNGELRYARAFVVPEPTGLVLAIAGALAFSSFAMMRMRQH